MAEIITVSYKSSKEDFEKIFSTEVGEVFKYEDDLDTLLEKIALYDLSSINPPLVSFTIKVVTPGTQLYSLYNNCIVVLDKQ